MNVFTQSCLAIVLIFMISHQAVAEELSPDNLYVFSNSSPRLIQKFKSIVQGCRKSSDKFEMLLNETQRKRVAHIPTRLWNSSDLMLIAKTRDTGEGRADFHLDMNDIMYFPSDTSSSSVPAWGTTRCDLIIHETIEFSYLMDGLRELAFELPYDKRGDLLQRTYLFAHTKGIEAENSLRVERKAKDFRSMSCDNGEYLYMLIGRYSEKMRIRESNFVHAIKPEYPLNHDGCLREGVKMKR